VYAVRHRPGLLTSVVADVSYLPRRRLVDHRRLVRACTVVRADETAVREAAPSSQRPCRRQGF